MERTGTSCRILSQGRESVDLGRGEARALDVIGSCERRMSYRSSSPTSRSQSLSDNPGIDSG